MTPAIAILLSVTPRPLAALQLWQRLGERPTAEELIALGPEIEAAIDEADDMARRVDGAVQRCLKLRPTSATQTPPGF